MNNETPRFRGAFFFRGLKPEANTHRPRFAGQAATRRVEKAAYSFTAPLRRCAAACPGRQKLRISTIVRLEKTVYLVATPTLPKQLPTYANHHASLIDHH
ncbi:hypothetical protein [Flaviaesturariibacter aridisoli]|uniref:Uncharacterized protein n=1 Tax=Flaviaesturariibacter aridisoli TaxID=2545761 RepID=A0A4V2WN94_9BACT|nr:hypothetical protein [Flaviaesturariibacter aridisoli]TCZ74572.1 hypothetical protein E0486_02795 [Flaviaesturariibacter aridisoli]